MRTNWQVSTLPLSIALVLGACGTHKEQSSSLPDDLKKDLAVASASSSDLAIATPSYQRMRFVSGVEQIPSAAPAKRPKPAHKKTRTTAPRPSTTVATTDAVPDPMATMASESPAPATTTDPVEPEAPTTVAQAPVSGPSNEPSSAPGASSEGAGNRGHGGSLGGILGGIIGAVVIRGGAGGIDHCDPRHEGGVLIPIGGRRPVYGMPVHRGPVFGGVRR